MKTARTTIAVSLTISQTVSLRLRPLLADIALLLVLVVTVFAGRLPVVIAGRE